MVNSDDDDVTFQAAEHHRSLATVKLYCLVTYTRCEQLAQSESTASQIRDFSESLSLTSHNHYFITP